MRLLRTGIDAAGRTCVVHETTFAPTHDGISNEVVCASDGPFPSRPHGHGAFSDVKVPAGATKWAIVNFPAGTEIPRHHSDSVDLDTVVSGSIELILDDGVHLLGPGDCAVVPGIDHAWRVGAQDCVVSIVLIGTAPPP